MKERKVHAKAWERVKDPYARIATEIVIYAIKDWRQLVARKAWKNKTLQQNNKNFTELRNFFKSEWCALLMQGFEIRPEEILKKLEAELLEAKEKDKERKVKK